MLAGVAANTNCRNACPCGAVASFRREVEVPASRTWFCSDQVTSYCCTFLSKATVCRRAAGFRTMRLRTASHKQRESVLTSSSPGRNDYTRRVVMYAKNRRHVAARNRVRPVAVRPDSSQFMS